MSKLKYPEEVFFHESLCSTLLVLEKSEEAKSLAQESLKKFPGNFVLLTAAHVALMSSWESGDDEDDAKFIPLIKESVREFLFSIST